MPENDQQFGRLPQPIIDRLREMDGPAVMPDPAHDADVLSGARQHFAEADEASGLSRQRRNLRLFIGGGLGGAVAAMVGIVVLIGSPARETSPGSPELAMQDQVPAMSLEASPATPGTYPPGDVNADGQINILDAYVLAKQVDRRAFFYAPANDMNSDNVIDQRDVDLIASQAVTLNPGEPS